MSYRRAHLDQDDDALLAECERDTYKASGPGGQHRNKVSSAVRLRHRPTGISAHGDDSRSQHENKRRALKRLRMHLATRRRVPVEKRTFRPPPILTACMYAPRGRKADAPRRLEIGRKDHRFWHVAAVLLDVLDACDGRLSDAAGLLGITTGNLVRLLKSDRHLLAAAQQLRRAHGQKPVS